MSFLFGTQQQLTNPLVKSSFFLLWKNRVSQGLLFAYVLTLSCLGSLWFGNHWHYSSNPYVYLCYLWSISITKDTATVQNIFFYVWSISIARDRHYWKHFILCVVYFYSERLPLCRGVQPETFVELAKQGVFFFFFFWTKH